MTNQHAAQKSGIGQVELEEWYDSLDDLLHRYGPEQVQQLLTGLKEQAYLRGVTLPFTANTPYINTIDPDDQAVFPPPCSL